MTPLPDEGRRRKTNSELALLSKYTIRTPVLFALDEDFLLSTVQYYGIQYIVCSPWLQSIKAAEQAGAFFMNAEERLDCYVHAECFVQ